MSYTQILYVCSASLNPHCNKNKVQSEQIKLTLQYKCYVIEKPVTF